MNKIASNFIRGRISLICHRCVCVIQPKILYYSTTSVFLFPHFQRQDHKQSSLFQTSLAFERQMSIMSKAKKKLYGLVSDNVKVKAAGILAYEKVGDNVDYNAFFQCFQLPDTFQTWFLSMSLHVYMVSLTTCSETYGKSFRHSLVDSMWHDVEMRLDELADMRSSQKKKYLTQLLMQFRAGLISYDEGILSGDTVLAAAAWRMLFGMKPVDPEMLENAVLYIRKQLSHLDSQNMQNVIFRGAVTFLPLNSIFSGEKELYST